MLAGAENGVQTSKREQFVLVRLRAGGLDAQPTDYLLLAAGRTDVGHALLHLRLNELVGVQTLLVQLH